ncbi:hypothetical protein DPMN_175270 [Dreissena polymorpha]|uniref:Uncharacterized protein n=1 Tax=Dreissena polymorpha TaxID=45954 RepID=A0A9D4IHY6_DREPO|nr:hypothetical protein DPMN_175270 [Dreissena polymorpha]
MAIQNTFLVEVCILLLECSENARCLAARGSHEESRWAPLLPASPAVVGGE